MVVTKWTLICVDFAALSLAVLCTGICPAIAVTRSETFTVGSVQTLPTHELAKELLGEQIASKVIEAVRHQYDTSEQVLPDYVEFYTQPELTDPRLNGICRTDVITVEYNWAELDRTSLTDSDDAQPPKSTVNASTPLKIAHVQAGGRYKSFPEPPSEPGTPENDREQAAACAQMTTAVCLPRSDGRRCAMACCNPEGICGPDGPICIHLPRFCRSFMRPSPTDASTAQIRPKNEGRKRRVSEQAHRRPDRPVFSPDVPIPGSR